ncbi:MAG: T9SS type A sorting domain-containing protein [Flavobacteriales bacterium]
MKITITLFTLILSVLALNSWSQATWENFDDNSNISYFFANGGLNENFANPNTGGINTSATCGEYMRANVPFDVIVIDPLGIDAVEDVNPYVDGTKEMTLKVLSPAAGITVQITLENATLAQPENFPTGRHSEYTAVTTTSGEWEELTFTFSNQPDVAMTGLEINRLVLLFAPNTTGTDTYLWDDLNGPEFEDPCADVMVDMAVIDDFDCQRNMSFDFTNGTLVQAEPNPETGGINASPVCAKFTKFPDGGDGAFGGALDNPFTSDDYSTVKLDLFATAEALNFLIIFQDNGGGDLIELSFTTSGVNEWQSFEGDLSPISSAEEIASVVLLLNPGSATEDFIYLDNFRLDFVDNVNENQATAEVNVYPIPFKNDYTVTSDQSISEIKVMDTTGRVVTELTSLSTSNISIDATEYASGTYILSIVTASGIVNKTLIK